METKPEEKVCVEGRRSRFFFVLKKQLGDREAKWKKNTRNLFWTISNKLVTTVPGDSSCLSLHIDMPEHTHANTHKHRRQSVWVSVTVGSVCTPQTVTPWKPSQNVLIKTSHTITAHPDALTFTPPMNTVSYNVSPTLSPHLSHTCSCY